MQTNGIADHQQQRHHQQQGQAEDKALAKLENRRQTLDPEQVELRLLHAGQLGQAQAQGLQGALVDFLGSNQYHARQRILRQLLERFAQAGLLLEFRQGLLAADPLGLGDFAHRGHLLA
ncbi:hypothetical protein D9M68_819060 [compost metagenome]